jgi:pimeloyl-ACP methyl ester carboxylesterase
LAPNWLLLHGTPLTPECWDEVAPRLREHGQVACPDVTARPGEGQAQVAARLLADLAADDPGATSVWHVVGHSFGGQVALEIALAAPGQVRTLTLLCTRDTPYPAFTATAAALRRGDPIDSDAALRRWFRPVDLDTGSDLVTYARRCLDTADRETWAAALDAIATYDRAAETSTIDIPVTLFAAEDDQVSTPDAMRELADRIPGAVLQVAPGAAHLTPFLDPAALTARIVLAAARSTGQ